LCARLGGVSSGRLERGGDARPFGAHLELVRAHRLGEVVARVFNLRLQRDHGLLKLGAQRLVGAPALIALDDKQERRLVPHARAPRSIRAAGVTQWLSAWRGRQLALARLLRGRQVQRLLLGAR